MVTACPRSSDNLSSSASCGAQVGASSFSGYPPMLESGAMKWQVGRPPLRTRPTITPLALGHSDFTRAVWKGIYHQWQEGLAHSLSSSALDSVRTFNGPCPWAHHPNRSVDVALTLLQVGHLRLAAHICTTFRRRTLHTARGVPHSLRRWNTSCCGAHVITLHGLLSMRPCARLGCTLSLTCPSQRGGVSPSGPSGNIGLYLLLPAGFRVYQGHMIHSY